MHIFVSVIVLCGQVPLLSVGVNH